MSCVKCPDKTLYYIRLYTYHVLLWTKSYKLSRTKSYKLSTLLDKEPNKGILYSKHSRPGTDRTSHGFWYVTRISPISHKQCTQFLCSVTTLGLDRRRLRVPVFVDNSLHLLTYGLSRSDDVERKGWSLGEPVAPPHDGDEVVTGKNGTSVPVKGTL